MRKSDPVMGMSVVLLLVLSFSQAVAVTLVEDGEARARIVTASEPVLPVQLAVAELNHHLEKVTGARLEVVRASDEPIEGPRVLVGASMATRRLGLSNEDFQKQEYLIRTPDERTLVLMGRDAQQKGELRYQQRGMWKGFNFFTPVGTCYAVYDFLERACGVRWYLPNTPTYDEEVTTVLSAKPTLRVSGLDIRRKPWTEYRMMGHGWRNIPRKLYLWDMRNLPENPRKIRLSRRNARLYWLRQRMGGEPFAANHSFNRWPKRFPKRQFPEYWAKNTAGEPVYTQLNYASDEVVDRVMKDIKAWQDGRPRDEEGLLRIDSFGKPGNIVALVPFDGRGWSQDPVSQKLIRDEATRHITGFNTDRTSRYVFQFVNKVARRVRQFAPEVRVSTLAYSDYYFPPRNMSLPDNLEVMVCTQLIKLRTQKWDQAYYDSLRQWQEKVGRVYIWEYFNFPQWRKMNVFPGLVPRRIGRHAVELRRIGIEGMFLEYNEGKGFGWPNRYLLNPAMEHINYYFMLRLLNTQRRSGQALLEEYYRKFYGPAAEPMRKFFTRIEQTYLSDELRPDKGRTSKLSAEDSWLIYCPPEKLAMFEGLIERAKALAADRSPYAERIELIDKAVYQFMETSSKRYRRRANLDYELTVPKAPDGAPWQSGPDSEVWRSAPRTHKFLSMSGFRTRLVTWARTLWDDQYLYVLFRCEDDNLSELADEQRPHDGAIWPDDGVEVFLDVNKDEASYYHYAANAGGSLFDERRGPKIKSKKTARQWDSDFDLKIIRKDHAWFALFRIPFKEIGGTPEAGDVWGTNLTRFHRRSTHDLFAFKVTGSSFHNPSSFGTFRFVSK